MINPEYFANFKLQASVGRGGRNLPKDTEFVQLGLNNLPPALGGSSPKLTVDGICGPKTITAITTFQRSNQLGMTGVMTPEQGYRLGQIIQWVLDPKVHAAALNMFIGYSTIPTKWRIASSGGFSVSIKELAITGGHLFIENDGTPGQVYKFYLAGAGSGISIMPYGFDLSSIYMPGGGYRIYRPMASAEPTFDSLAGMGALITIGGGVYAGASAGLFLFHVNEPNIVQFINGALAGLKNNSNPAEIMSVIRMLFAVSRGGGLGFGAIYTSPNAGVSLYTTMLIKA